jgi:hypothetical protein
MTYTVSLELPDLCDPGDWQDREPTPVDAVEAFQHALNGSPDLYVYRVTASDGRSWLVDMADGPSTTEAEPI